MSFYRYVLVGLDGCEVGLCGPCALERPRVPCVSRLPPVSFYRYVYDQDDSPINGLCSHEFFVLARAVSATPPSIVIVALVLGGRPERVRVVLSSSSR